MREEIRPVVLVVDDDDMIRELTRNTLEQAGFSVEEAPDGETGLVAFQDVRPDIVLLDVIMSGKDGFSVCEEIRGMKGGDTVPILIVTGLDDLDSINRAYEVGASDFILKPINWRVLGHHVKYMLRSGRAFSRLKDSEVRNAALLNAMPDMMLRMEKSGIILECTGSEEIELLRPSQEIRGMRIDHALPPEIAEKILRSIDEALKSGNVQRCEYQIAKGDTVHYYEARIVRSGESEALAIIRDISDRKNAERRVMQLAYFDSLTDLPNRALLKDRLHEAQICARRSNKKVAILFLDLDRFKNVNDTLGHNIGDLLLRSVAERLKKCLRKTDFIAREEKDEAKATIARIGGDEFTILLSDISEIQQVMKVADRLMENMRRSFILGPHEVFISASIGISIYPTDSEDADTLMKYADIAMYHAKGLGRNNVQFYAESMNTFHLERFQMEKQIRHALENGEFLLHYQPLIKADNGLIKSVEALIRWSHPDQGILVPRTFIPIAEETSLILPLGEWVLQEACVQMQAWRLSRLSFERVSVNISNIQFRQSNFFEMVSLAIDKSGVDPCHLELELTESCTMENVDKSITVLKQLKNMGVHITIDDFGTGYSSLSYLKRLPIDCLKIDKSFVKDILHDHDSQSIVRAIIGMAHNMDLGVIAEGIETKEQFVFLRDCGCDFMQGYYFCEALSEDELRSFLRSWRAADALFSRR